MDLNIEIDVSMFQDSETSMPRRRSGSSKRLQNLLMSPFKKLGSGGNRHSNTSHASKVCNCSAYGDPGQCICIDNAERTIVERAVCYHPHHHHNSVDVRNMRNINFDTLHFIFIFPEL